MQEPHCVQGLCRGFSAGEGSPLFRCAEGCWSRDGVSFVKYAFCIDDSASVPTVTGWVTRTGFSFQTSTSGTSHLSRSVAPSACA